MANTIHQNLRNWKLNNKDIPEFGGLSSHILMSCKFIAIIDKAVLFHSPLLDKGILELWEKGTKIAIFVNPLINLKQSNRNRKIKTSEKKTEKNTKKKRKNENAIHTHT